MHNALVSAHRSCEFAFRQMLIAQQSMTGMSILGMSMVGTSMMGMSMLIAGRLQRSMAPARAASSGAAA